MTTQNELLKMETSVWVTAQPRHKRPLNYLSSGSEEEKAHKLAQYLEGEGAPSMADRWQNFRHTPLLDDRSYARLLLVLYRAENNEVAQLAVNEIKSMTFEGHLRRTRSRHHADALPLADAVDLLIAALSSKNSSAKSDAAERLGALGDKAAIKPLRRLLAPIQDSRVREAAAVALARLNDAAGVPVLLEMLGGPSGDAAAHLLLCLGEKRAIPMLRDTVWQRGSSTRKTLQIALDALEWLNDPSFLTTNDAYSYTVRGYLKNAKGDHDGAITEYTQALALDPNCGDTYRYRWEARRAKGEIGAAKADLVMAFRLGSFS